MKTQDISKLKRIIEDLNNANVEMLHKNLFAIGCYLNLVGNKRAGIKSIDTVLSSLGWNKRKTYFRNILDSVNGNERIYAEQIGANEEINELMKNIAD